MSSSDDHEQPAAPPEEPRRFKRSPSRLVVTSLDALSSRHGLIPTPAAGSPRLLITSHERPRARGSVGRLNDSIELFLTTTQKERPSGKSTKDEKKLNLYRLAPGQFLTSDHGTRYRVVSELGRGGMGVVIHATRIEHAPCSVAVKLLHGIGNIENLVQEYSAARLLNGHLNVADINVLGMIDGAPFGEFQFVNGATLKEIVTRHERDGVTYCVPQQLVAWVGWQTAEALSAAHNINAGGRRTGILHKDIKPSNIMIDHNGVVKVLDFGLAQDIEHVRREIAAGRVTGTPVIIPSELLMTPRGFARVVGGLYGAIHDPESLIDGRADVFSLACTMYYMLTGLYPSAPDGNVFGYDNPLVAINGMHLRPLNPPHLLVETISPVLSKIVYLGAHPDPRMRPDAETFCKYLGAFLYPETIGQGLFRGHIRDYLGLLEAGLDPSSSGARALGGVLEKAQQIIQDNPRAFPHLDALEARFQVARDKDRRVSGDGREKAPSKRRKLVAQQAAIRRSLRVGLEALNLRSRPEGPSLRDAFVSRAYSPWARAALANDRNPARAHSKKFLDERNDER